jgi:nucleoside 2-deoxyribosyltransferase
MMVYLAGPITGCDYEGCTDWREAVKHELSRAAIKGVSPMRGKEYLKDIGVISGTGEEYAHLGPISLPRGVMTRDRWDATRCSALLVNLLGATRVSIGTVMEIAWADLSRIPIICVMEDSGNPHEHMMVSEAIGYRVNNIPQAVHIIKAMMS